MEIRESANELIEIANTIAKEKNVDVIEIWDEAVKEFKRRYEC